MRNDELCRLNLLLTLVFLALLASGLGVHHAGLSIEDRKLAEELYLTGQIRTLVATSVSTLWVESPDCWVYTEADIY